MPCWCRDECANNTWRCSDAVKSIQHRLMQCLNQKNWYQIFQAFFLSFPPVFFNFYFSRTLLVFHSPFICTFICGRAPVCMRLWFSDSRWLQVSLFSFSPEKTHLFKVTQPSPTHSPPSPNKVYYVSAVPHRSDDSSSGTTEAATEGTSESFGPRDAPRFKLTDRRAATKSHRGACSLSLQRKRGVNDP